MTEETTPEGLYCSEADVEQGQGSTAIEKEADLFAATLLMPFHELRNQIGPKQRADFCILGRLVDSQTKCDTGYVRDRHGTDIRPRHA